MVANRPLAPGIHRVYSYIKLEIKVVYVLPQCASQSPASGDGNLLGHHLKMQDLNNTQALRNLAKGSNAFFPIFILDAGYQVFGNVTRTEANFLDFRTLCEEEGAIFLGKTISEGIYKMKILILHNTLKAYSCFYRRQSRSKKKQEPEPPKFAALAP